MVTTLRRNHMVSDVRIKTHKKALNPTGKKNYGGEDRIRTYEALASLTVFETAAFDHSATSPRTAYLIIHKRLTT